MDVLVHLVTPDEWAAYQAAGAIAPPSLVEVGFVHLSSPAQVMLPADRIHPGRTDLSLLVLDPKLIDAEIRWEPGVPSDPASMRFPHAYGPIPLTAVRSVVPYLPGTDGRFGSPRSPPTGTLAR